jgi:hypothetical protein
MHTWTTFDASAVGRDDLRNLLAEHMALERLRVVRRLLAVRFGLGALVTLLGSGVFGWLSLLECFVCTAVLSAVPLWVWLTELWRQRRMTLRLTSIAGATTQSLETTRTATGPRVSKRGKS